MARLNWDNVAAPDFSGAQSGLTSAAAMINQALAGAKTGLNEFEQIQDDKVNSGILAQLAAMQNPEDAARIPGLISSADPTQISAATFAALMGRGGQLRQNKLGEIELADTENKYNREMTFQRALDGAGAELSAYEAAIRNPLDQAGIQKASEAVSAKFGGAPIDKVMSFMDRLRGMESSSLGLASSRQSYGQTGQRFAWETQDRADQKIEKAALDTLIGMDDKAQQAQAIRGMNLPAGSKAALWQSLGLPQAMDYSGFDAAGAIGSAAGVGGNPTFGAPQQAVASTLKSGGLSDNVVAGFLGNFHVEGGYGGAQGDGGSAGGIAQWRNERRTNFQKIIGVDPTKATPDQQAKFVLWELNNPAAAGMTPQQAAAIKNAKSPEEAAALIDKHFERSDGTARGGRVSAATLMAQAMSNTGAAVSGQVGRASASMETVAPSPIADIFMRNAGKNNVSVRDAAKAMVAADPSLSQSKAEAAINDMMAEASKGFGGNKASARSVNPMMAADLIRHFSQTTGSRGFWDNTVRNFSSNITGGEELGKDSAGFNIFNPSENAVTFDRKSVLDQLKQYATGQMEGVIRGETERGVIGAQAKQAETALAAAQARYNTRLQRKNQGLPVSEQALASDLIAIQAAQAQLNALNGASGDPRSGVELHGRPSDAAPVVVVRNRPAPQPRASRPVAVPPSPPKANSAAGRRSRAVDMLGNAAMAVNPIYWAGRLIDGR